MMAADVVEMRVAGDAGQRPLRHQRHVGPEREMPEARVKQQIAVAPAHMPHVAAVEGLDPRLVNECDAVAHAEGLVPFGGSNAHGTGEIGIGVDDSLDIADGHVGQRH